MNTTSTKVNIDDYCEQVLQVWMENPPELYEGWLDEMVEKLVKTCKNPTAKETTKDTVPVVSPTEDIVEDTDDQEDINCGTEAHTEANRKKWMSKVGTTVRCPQCGRYYFPSVLKPNHQGLKVCPSCRS